MTDVVTNYRTNYPVVPEITKFPAKANTQPSVAISTPQGRQVYQYPQTSIYNEPNKQQGLNIYVFNPSGMGAPSTFTNNNYTTPQQTSSPIANTPLVNAKNSDIVSKKQKTKKIVKLTDDYIKTLENFLRSHDKDIRKQGIQDLIKRYEEDKSRYENPSLTALLNIALQDTNVQNRVLALSVIASGGAHGDNNTIQLLNGMTKSDKLYGQEAQMATKALLKCSHTLKEIPDDSSGSKEIKETDEKA